VGLDHRPVELEVRIIGWKIDKKERGHQQKFIFPPYTSGGMWGIEGRIIKIKLLYG